MRISFYGVRGSCPCPSDANRRYGGNTACVTLAVGHEPPIIFDLGTGLRPFGETQPTDGTFRGSALITHMHWDHVQGLPFFPPIDRVGAHLDIYGPRQVQRSLQEVFDDFMRPPYFPVHFSDLRGDIVFHDVGGDDLAIGQATVKVRSVPHTDITVGYRVEWDGVSVAYVSDHQAPLDLASVDEGVLELADGADLLIHDAQYTPEEFVEKAHWGHCTVDYAVHLAKLAGVRTLALFHHDPGHDDDRADALLAGARRQSEAVGGPAILAAYEGLVIEL